MKKRIKDITFEEFNEWCNMLVFNLDAEYELN